MRTTGGQHEALAFRLSLPRLRRRGVLDPSPRPAVTRRLFLYGVGAATVGGVALSALDLGAADDPGLPRRGPIPRRPLIVQPVLTYEVPQRREATSWRSWGGIQTDADAGQEKARIERELAEMARGADFPLEIRPVQARQGRRARRQPRPRATTT